MSFQDASKKVDSASSSLDRAYAVLGDERFQQSMDDLKSLPKSSLKNRLATIFNALEKAEKSQASMNAAEKNLQQNFRIYQWLVLVAIMGEVAGVAVVYA